MKYIFFACCISLIVAVGCKTSPKPEVPISDKETLLSVLDSDSVKIIDVRTIEEFQSGHVSKAINYPIESFSDSMPKLDKNERIIVVCKAGIRAGKAAKQLIDSGYVNIYNGGGWQNVQELTK